MAKLLPFGERERPVEAFEYTPEERQFISGVYESFQKMYTIRAESLDILGGRTLQQYWDESVRGYAVLSTELRDPNDPVTPYLSTIQRDKSDVFIANLTAQLLYADVIAQNVDQEIDAVVSKVSSALLEWAYKTDGWPSESGQQKNSRYIHKAVVEGTCHVLDLVTKDGLTSELIPNEELYIGNFWQPDIQKQPVVIRAKTNILYEEAEAMFGEMENWKCVRKGAWINDWLSEFPYLKNGFDGIEWEDKVQILYVWKHATPRELAELKKQGKVKKSDTRACFYNVIINDIPMFPVDNLSPYKHGFYPIAKCKFQEFAKPEFYYGNSAPNKIREDAHWLSSWKTLLRYKGKLGVLKPSLVIGGTIEEDILLPSKMTPVDAGVQVVPIAGVSDGISQSDITLLQLAESEIDRGSVSATASGQQSQRKETARETVIRASAAEKLLDGVSQQIAFFQASRSFPILLAMLQMIPKREIKKVAIPDQTLNDGLRGSLEVLFENPGMLTEDEEMEMSFDMRMQSVTSRKAGTPKDTVMINPAYLRDLRYYVTSDASSILQDKSAMKQAAFMEDLPLMLGNPDLFDRKETAREYVRVRGLSNRLLSTEEAPAAPPQVSGATPPAAQMPTEEAEMNDVSQAMTGMGLPKLSGT